MLKTEKINNVTVVQFQNIDRFNAIVVEPIKEELKSLFNKPKTKLALDLGSIKYVDSSGFGVFISILKTANTHQGQFKIFNIREEVFDLFKLLQLHTIFEIYQNQDECISSFN